MNTPNITFKVVVNHEEQYSTWPASRPLPHGWQEAGASGTQEECLEYIERTWLDLRPRSTRRV